MSARFWGRVDKAGPDATSAVDGQGLGPCWPWCGTVDVNGYGRFATTIGGRRVTWAHRVSYELSVGPIPAGLELDHLCRVPLCVNPTHLEPVTRKENVRRGIGHGSETHCPNGHEYTEENTYFPKRGGRMCRACRVGRDPEKRHEIYLRMKAKKAEQMVGFIGPRLPRGGRRATGDACGTERGADRHRRRGDEVCAACREAVSAVRRERRNRREAGHASRVDDL